MIVKIMCYDKNQDFWMFDNIRKVSVSKLMDSLKEDQSDDADLRNKNTRTTKYMRLVCRLNDGNEYTISFNTVAFLMNDDGKTIERIHVHGPLDISPETKDEEYDFEKLDF